MDLSLLLPNDSSLFWVGLRHLLEHQPDTQVVAQADDGQQLVELAARLQPDVVMLDVQMEHPHACEVAARILRRTPDSQVIAISARGNRECIARMFRAGVMAYLLKDDSTRELAQALAAVRQKRRYVCQGLSSLVVEEFLRGQIPNAMPGSALTSREKEVLQLLADGKSTKETAALLHVSASTIESHRRHLMKKLDLYSIAELTKYAIREGLTTVDC